jgi:hypothetical protein
VIDQITTALIFAGSLKQPDPVVGILHSRREIHRAAGGGLIRLIGQSGFFQHRFGIPRPLRTIDSEVVAAISIPIADDRKVLAGPKLCPKVTAPPAPVTVQVDQPFTIDE